MSYDIKGGTVYNVYILYSEKSSRYYTGQTVNIKERLRRHNQGRVKSTAYFVPWKVILTITVESRTEAVKLERKIKKRGARRFVLDYKKM